MSAVLGEPLLGTCCAHQEQDDRVDDDGRPAIGQSEESKHDVDHRKRLDDHMCLLGADPGKSSEPDVHDTEQHRQQSIDDQVEGWDRDRISLSVGDRWIVTDPGKEHPDPEGDVEQCRDPDQDDHSGDPTGSIHRGR